MKSILSLALTAVALTSATPLLKRTVAQVETDINNIGTAVTNLDNAINAFPSSGGSLAAALVRLIHHSPYMGLFLTTEQTIHNDAVALEGQLTNATSDVKVSIRDALSMPVLTLVTLYLGNWIVQLCRCYRYS
jgi:hypothetical protein